MPLLGSTLSEKEIQFLELRQNSLKFVRLECCTEEHNKFYEYEVSKNGLVDAVLTKKYGPIGASGTTRTEAYQTLSAARQALVKDAAGRLKKGYAIANVSLTDSSIYAVQGGELKKFIGGQPDDTSPNLGKVRKLDDVLGDMAKSSTLVKVCTAFAVARVPFENARQFSRYLFEKKNLFVPVIPATLNRKEGCSHGDDITGLLLIEWNGQKLLVDVFRELVIYYDPSAVGRRYLFRDEQAGDAEYFI